jgi:hypothetical protein
MAFFKYSILFILFILLSYLGMLFLGSKIMISGKPALVQTNNFYHWKGGDTYHKYHNFKIDSVYDFIFVGSSRAYRGYNPFIFEKRGFSAWNLGSNAQTMNNSLEVIKQYINKQNCRNLIVDIYPSALMHEGFESSIDLIQNSSSNRLAWNIAKNSKDMRLMNAFIHRIFTLNAPIVFETEDYIGKGFCTKKDTLNLKKIKQLQNYSAKKNKTVKPILAEHKALLEKLILYCNEKEINLMLVFSPTSDAYSQDSYESHIKELKQIADQHQIQLLDYAKKLQLNSYTDFYDDSHMNERGVNKFNESLIKEIISLK